MPLPDPEELKEFARRVGQNSISQLGPQSVHGAYVEIEANLHELDIYVALENESKEEFDRVTKIMYNTIRKYNKHWDIEFFFTSKEDYDSVESLLDEKESHKELALSGH